jgi:hypothetical protein
MNKQDYDDQKEGSIHSFAYVFPEKYYLRKFHSQERKDK